MPTYEYLCESCGARYEKREGFNAPARQKCQGCGKSVRRVLHAPPIVFKGSGFYVTDARGGTNGASTTRKSDDGAGETTESTVASPDNYVSDSDSVAAT